MKQIIIISAIHRKEYNIYSTNEFEIIGPFKTKGHKLLLLNGQKTSASTNQEIVENIITKINDIESGTYDETIIAFHFTSDISELLREKLVEDKYGKVIIKKYGSGGNHDNEPLYKDYLLKLGEEFKNNGNNIDRIDELIIGLYNYFNGDSIFEAKLNLLHQCLTPQGAKEATNTEWLQGEAKTKFEALTKIDGDDPFAKGYIDALTSLRDELLKEY